MWVCTYLTGNTYVFSGSVDVEYFNLIILDGRASLYLWWQWWLLWFISCEMLFLFPRNTVFSGKSIISWISVFVAIHGCYGESKFLIFRCTRNNIFKNYINSLLIIIGWYNTLVNQQVLQQNWSAHKVCSRHGKTSQSWIPYMDL